MSESALRIVPADSAHWADLEALFGRNGACAGCWCMFWRDAHWGAGPNRGAQNKAALRELCADPIPPGILACRGDEAVGWCSLAPRPAFPRLARSRKYKALDDLPVWSIVCFFIAKQARRQGVQTALIDGAVKFAVSHGAKIVEAYPSDLEAQTNVKLSGSSGYRGIASSFAKAGFQRASAADAPGLIMRWYPPAS